MTTEAAVTITREQLIAVAEDTIRRARELTDVPESLEARVMEVARTVTRVIEGWWDEEAECGCLIGTLYGPDVVTSLFGATTIDELPGRRAEVEIGAQFPVAMIHQLGEHHGMYTPIDVIEA